MATLYNGMFSTDRGLDETEQPFAIYSFDRVSCEFFLPLAFFSRARGNERAGRSSIRENLIHLYYFVIRFHIDIAMKSD